MPLKREPAGRCSQHGPVLKGLGKCWLCLYDWTAGDCKFECALEQVVSAPTLLSGLCASAARVPKSQNWCQMCVNIKTPPRTFLFPQSSPCSPDTNARRTLRPQGQPLLTRPAAGHLWDLQASCSELENVHTHRQAYLMYCVSHWSRKFWAFFFFLPALFLCFYFLILRTQVFF